MAESVVERIEATVEHARQVLDFPQMKNRIQELEQLMNAPDFWQDQNKARQVSQEVADLRKELEEWESVEEELVTLKNLEELAREESDEKALQDVRQSFDVLAERVQKLEMRLLFSGEYDQNNAIISIHAGAGGLDAMDWAERLMRMFIRFAETKDWQVDVLEMSRAEDTGIKSATFAMRGRFAYGHMKNEAGVHRLVRISPFDAEGMRHTSFALVEVIPELDDVSDRSIEIDPKDLRIDTFMAGGHGGQSVNTTYSAVRITHIPTNLVVTCQNERSQLQNKETAMRVLKSRLLQRMIEEHADRLDQIKGGHKSPEWGNQIRSYVFHPYQLVKDHRTDHETTDVEGVMNGNIDAFIQAHLRQEAVE